MVLAIQILLQNGIFTLPSWIKGKDVDKILSLLDNFVINLGYETKKHILFLNIVKN